MDERRFDSERKLPQELNYMARKQDQKASLAQKEKWKKFKLSKTCYPDPRLLQEVGDLDPKFAAITKEEKSKKIEVIF